jgi:hypothetical protein
MWKNGGIFSDFSFFFMKPLPLGEGEGKVQQGYYISSPYCRDMPAREYWEREMMRKMKDKFHASINGSLCVTSTVMVFNKPEHPIIM